MKKYLFIFIIFFANYNFFAALEKDENKPKVYIEELKKADIFDIVNYSGFLSPLIFSRVYSPVNAIVTKLLVSAGQKVKKGEVLAILKQNEIGLNIRPVTIVSPILGYLYQPLITQMAMVDKNVQLFTIFDNSKLKLSINVTPEDAKNIQIGQAVTIKNSNQLLEGKIIAISPDIDILSGTVLVNIEIPNENKSLIPGYLVEATFDFNHRKGYLISNKFVRKRGNLNYLYTIDKNSKVKEMPIESVNGIKDNFEIFGAGLEEGLKFITKSSLEQLSNGQQVLVVKNEK